MGTLQLGVLVSGSGTNLQAVLDACQSGQLDADVRIVLSNRRRAQALQRAQKAGVPTTVVRHRAFSSREQFDSELVRRLREAGAEWVLLAGFMRVVTPVLLDAFPMRVVNIHPALLPAFPGLDAQRQALEYGVRYTGCTTHFVDAGTDTGPIIAQAVVPVEQDDTRDTLAERILEQEHRLVVQTLRWIAEGRVTVEPASGNQRPIVRIRPEPATRRQDSGQDGGRR